MNVTVKTLILRTQVFQAITITSCFDYTMELLLVPVLLIGGLQLILKTF
jgi:hypothetical protein